MLKVGITGGIGVGKTIVSRIFSLLGVPVYDSDGRAKWVMRHNAVLQQELTGAFGEETFTEEGELNRAYLAKIVFKNPQRLEQLNRLVHPHVRRDFLSWVAGHADKPYVMKEAALMYESEAWRQIDTMIAVYAPMNVRIKRLLLRDTHRTEDDVRAIIEKQLSEEEKMARADHIIYNDDQQLVIPQVLALHAHFLKQALV
ncbi:dephospho-CoA kinase [Pontibacter sp. MBLB2868]|uniref:dephospho-CoA kinase n=1 Tax=Pontibacter sp. MBLB2868 TaxID=3451555 RepID=UPI003F750D17